MSAALDLTVPAGAPGVDDSRDRRPSFARLVGVELRKSYDTRAGFWLLATMGIVTTIVFVIMFVVAAVQDTTFSFDDFTAAAAFGNSVFLPILGILLVTSEWGQRTALTTFALTPRRGSVIGAKLVAGLVWTVAVAVFAVVVGALVNGLQGLVLGEAIWSFGWRDLLAFLITQSLAMLGGFALATLLLNSPGAIVAFFAYKWIIPVLFGVAGEFAHSFRDITPWFDFQSAQAPIWDWSFTGEGWAQLLVSGSFWLLLPLGLGLARVLRAEVK